ncbi:VRK3 kinase, partial [Polyodon spathula]|nr:VRK3 kinase [Polyodon spathula]
MDQAAVQRESVFRCERALLFAAAAADFLPLVTALIVRFCPHCGTKAGFKFCPSCGEMLPQLDPEEIVHLAGYCYAFRYSPSGNHIEYQELSRTPNEGAVEFLSIDSHKGAGPSCRSDLQSLGYCMLKWMCGSLPWSDQIDNPSAVMAEKERQVPGRSMFTFIL